MNRGRLMSRMADCEVWNEEHAAEQYTTHLTVNNGDKADTFVTPKKRSSIVASVPSK